MDTFVTMLVSTFVTVTTALETTAPLESVTAPTIEPVVVCAVASEIANRMLTATVRTCR